MSAFTFQPQNLVANPDVFFYKADTYEHREKLRTIFPYVLDAVTPQMLAKQHEYARLRKELRRKEGELATVREVSERWMSEIRTHAVQARELGLISEPIPVNATRNELIDMLTRVVESSTGEIRITTTTINESIGELVDLTDEESSVSMELSGLRRRLAEMSLLRKSTEQYQGALQVQRDRLHISSWLRNTHDQDANCPLCDNQLESATQQLDALSTSLEELEKTAGEFREIPAAFDREFERVQADMRTTSERLQGIRIRIRSLERTSEEARQRQYDSLAVSRYIGRLEQSLQTYTQIGLDSALAAEVNELRDQVDALSQEISEAQIRVRTERALQAVNLNAGKLLPDLDVERPNDPISLSVEDLTIRVRGSERDDYLWEIGSGSNWLAYHVAVSLGLHQFFLSRTQSPVPSFIVYDQPSQVYFPKRLATLRDDEQENDLQFANDEDLEAVRKVFRVLSSVTISSKGELQIIVLDHAANDVWGAIPNVHQVDEWRNGQKLIPEEWLSANQPST
jgi:hypothetical protein